MGKQRYSMGPNLLTLFRNDVHQQIGLHVLPTVSSEKRMQEGIRTFCRMSCLNNTFYTTVVHGTLVNSTFWLRVAQILGMDNDKTEKRDTRAHWYERVKNKVLFMRNITKYTPRVRCTCLSNSRKKNALVICDDTGINSYFFRKKELVTYNGLSKEERCIGKEGDIDFRFVAARGFVKNGTIATHTKYVAIHEGTSICITSWENRAFCKRIVLSDNASVRGMQFDADTLVILIKDSEGKGRLLFYSIRDEKYTSVDFPAFLDRCVLDEGVRTQFFIMPQYIVFVDRAGNCYVLDKNKKIFYQEFRINRGFTSLACSENTIAVTYPLFPHIYQVVCMPVMTNGVVKTKNIKVFELRQNCEGAWAYLIDTCIFYTSLFFLMYSSEKLYVLLYDMKTLCFRKKIVLPIEDQGPSWDLVVTNNSVHIVDVNSFKGGSTIFTLDFTGEPIVSRAKKNSSFFSGLEIITEKFRSMHLTR